MPLEATRPTAFLAFLRPTLHLSVSSTRQLAVLALPAEAKKPVDFGAVARNLKISKPALSRHLDSLERNKFSERSYTGVAYEEDRRKVFAGITQNGREFLERMGVSCS